MDRSEHASSADTTVPLRSHALRLCGVLVVAVAVSCTLFETVPEQRSGWNEDLWGPVMPHQTFPAECDLCHVTETWTEIKEDFQFDHEAETGVPLLGAHARGTCLRCHNDRGPVQQFAALGCNGCHVDPHEGGLSGQCASCHSERNWTPEGMIVKHLETGFPLYGSHAAISCDQCHPNARSQDFRGAPATCIDCHRDDQQRAVSPDHLAGDFVDCERCHSVFVWEDAIFDHGTFPLVGGHATVDCAQCHPNNSFAGTPRACSACHLDDYNATNDPNHVTAGFSTQCETCHTVNGWGGATFSHATWPLTGAHLAASCNACHQNGVFAGTPRNCVDCHQAEYNATSNPNHVTAGFGTACETCHTTTAWQGATFNHSTWPLTGAHVAASCNSCHQNGVFAGTPRNCVDCHQADYNATTNPNHTAASFPTNCESCHTTAQWQGAVFNHTFDIQVGVHRTFACVDCHPNQADFKVFTCTTCHDQVKMNDTHLGKVAGYVYQNSACLSCHPTGK